MKLVVLITIFFNIYLCCLCCDIFIASKCPAPPGPTSDNFNWTLYCNGAKEHVDCINKKLKTCKNIQEFGPALETMKWNVKVIIDQGRSHGCTDLSDKIKLPRLPRKKATTTEKTKTTEEDMTERTSPYVDPNCHRNLIDKYCDKLDVTIGRFLFEDEAETSTEDFNNCKKIGKFNQCFQTNFRRNCFATMYGTFTRLERLISQCTTKVKANQPQGTMGKNQSNRPIYNFIHLTLFVIYSFNLY